MPKSNHQRAPKVNSTAYYIEEVVSYRSEYEAGNRIENSYPPIVAELLLAMLISLRAIRFTFCLMAGAFLYLMVKLLLVV